MNRHSKRAGLVLALTAAVIAALLSSPPRAADKVTVLKSNGPVLDEPGRRVYYESLSGDESKILALRKQLIAAGARNVNAFLPNLIVCEVPWSVDTAAFTRDPDILVSNENEIDHERGPAPIFSREWAKRCYMKYEEMAAAHEHLTPNEPSPASPYDREAYPISSVRRIPDEVIQRDARRVAAQGDDGERLVFQNSEMMTGDILLNLIFPESYGTAENWTNDEIGTAAAGFVVAVIYFESEFRRADANFITRRVYPAATSTEPITYTMGQDSLWVTNVMAGQGYNDAQCKYLETVSAYNNDWRKRFEADWVLTAFVVRAVNDTDHKFKDARNTGYSYLGGPFMAVPYPAGEFGSELFTQTVKLEMSHVFWALGEAFGSPDKCEDASGYLKYLNSNKTDGFDIYGNPSSCLGVPVPCLANKDNMLEERYTGAPCRYTIGQMGGIDENPMDGVPDAFGLAPVINFGTTAVETLTSQATSVSFTATSQYVANRNPLQNPQLRRNYAAPISDANYTFNGIGPISINTTDGEFDEAFEEFVVVIPVLLPGYSDLEVSVRNSYGAQTRAGKQIFFLGLDYYGFRFVHGNDGVGLAWSMRGATFNADFDLHRIDHNAGDEDIVVATGLRPVGSVKEGGLTPYYHYDNTVSPGLEYSYYLHGSFELLYRGVMTTFTSDSDTFTTLAAFPREKGILSSPSPNPFHPGENARVWISVSVPNANAIVSSQSIAGGPRPVSMQNDPDPVLVTIRVYDVLGRLVKNLYEDRVYVTVVNKDWDGTDQRGVLVPSGMYFIKAKAGTEVGTKKVLVIY